MVIWAPIIAGVASSLMGSMLSNKNKKAKVNTEGLTSITNQAASQQRGIANDTYTALQDSLKNYGTEAGQLGADYEGKANQIGEDYQKSLSTLGQADKDAAERAIAMKSRQSSAQIPLAQQSIREALAATGGLRTGSAGRALAQPVVQAQQQTADLADTLAIQNLGKQSARQEKGVDALYNSKAGAALQRFGLDKETMNTLLQSGRTDLITRATQLLGISSQEVANLLGIGGINVNNSLAQTAAANANQNSIVEALMKMGGGLIGQGVGGSSNDKAVS
jgi:hypothetical protein